MTVTVTVTVTVNERLGGDLRHSEARATHHSSDEADELPPEHGSASLSRPIARAAEMLQETSKRVRDLVEPDWQKCRA